MDVLRRSPGKLYLHVADILRQRLRSGDLSPGDRLKPISEFAEELSVATVTIRQAVAILEGEGRLIRQQGVGTFVTENAASDDTFAVGLDWPELLDMVTKTDPRLIEKRENVKLKPADLKGGKAAPSYVFLRRVNALKGNDCLVADAYDDRSGRHGQGDLAGSATQRAAWGYPADLDQPRRDGALPQ